MNKRFGAVLVLAILVATMIRAEDEAGDVEYYRKFAVKQLAATDKPVRPPVIESAGRPVARAVVVSYYEEEPANVITAAPQYHHSRSDNDGRANGAGVSLQYTHRFNDWFSLGVSYQFTLMDITGGMIAPAGINVPAESDVRWQSHSVGLTPEFRLPGFGTLQLSLNQSFDRAGGHERVGNDVRSIDDLGADVTSLAAWWERDVALDQSGAWTVTPYAGWRSLYRSVKNVNDWTAAPGVTHDAREWRHFVSGGLKLSFRSGPVRMSVRGGINHRTGGVSDRDNHLPGYGSRAVAPGVTLFSHRADRDRTVGSVGANINYAIGDRANVGIGYEGMFGKDTSVHMGMLNVVFPF